MRTIMAAGLAVLAIAATGGAANADPYRWCADYGGRGGGGTNCYFLTLQQCQSSISGRGGFCRPNPFYTGPDGSSRRSKRRQ